jgi:TetR/AcrR family transcriptional regulator
MFEALIVFIEARVFGLITQLTDQEPAGPVRARKIVSKLLQFGEKNPGMCRVMVGDAMVYEHERLQQRMNHLFDKVEVALRESLSQQGSSADTLASASVLAAFATGRLQRFARTGFRRLPSEQLDACLARIV